MTFFKSQRSDKGEEFANVKSVCLPEFRAVYFVTARSAI